MDNIPDPSGNQQAEFGATNYTETVQVDPNLVGHAESNEDEEPGTHRIPPHLPGLSNSQLHREDLINDNRVSVLTTSITVLNDLGISPQEAGTETFNASGSSSHHRDNAGVILSVSTHSGTGTAVVLSSQPRFGFPTVTSVSMVDIRSRGHRITTTPSASTAISSPTLKIMYVRKGVDPELPRVDPIPAVPTSSQSNNFLVLQSPTFLEVQSSENSIDVSQRTTTTAHPVIISSENNAFLRAAHTTKATRSLPHITPSSDSGVSDESTDAGFAFSRFQRTLHRSHSWPSSQRISLCNFTAYLATYLDDTTDSEFDLQENSENNTFFSSSYASPLPYIPPVSVTNDENDDGTTEQSITGSGPSRLITANNSSAASEPAPIMEIDAPTQHVRPGTPVPCMESYNHNDGALIEHPFLEPQRRLLQERVIRQMFADSMDIQPGVSTPRGLRLSRGREISMLPRRDQGILTWTGRLRAQLLLNVRALANNMQEDADSDDSNNDSMVNAASDLSLLDLDEPNEGDGEQVDPPGDEFEDEELEDGIADDNPDDNPDDSSSNSSSENSSSSDGRGDAASIDSTTSSSTTSVSSHASEAAQRQDNPSFPCPSESNLGGKYAYLNTSITRPRAADGHRFVVSIFGATTRRNNELKLPSWVPHYADRLQCILNQFLRTTESSHDITQPAVQVLHDVPQHQSAHSFKSVVTCTASQENQLEIGSMTPSKQLKSCLKIDGKGSTGETMPKIISWSQKIIQNNDSGLVQSQATDDPSDANGNEIEESDNPSKTQSCPEVLFRCEVCGAEVEEIHTNIVPVPVIHESLETENNSKKTRKRKGLAVRLFGRLLCNCGQDLKKSSSLDCTKST